jgi:hypothetical protein
LRRVDFERIWKLEETLFCLSKDKNESENEVAILDRQLIMFFEEILQNTKAKSEGYRVGHPSQAASRMITKVMMDQLRDHTVES